AKSATASCKYYTCWWWDRAARSELFPYTTLFRSVNSVAYAPDGKTLASASNDNTVRLWDVATSKEIRAFTGHQGYVQSVAYAPEDRKSTRPNSSHVAMS